MANCKYCSQEIKWEQEGGKWIPYNLDGSRHNCRNNNQKQSTVWKQEFDEFKKEVMAELGEIKNMLTKMLNYTKNRSTQQ